MHLIPDANEYNSHLQDFDFLGHDSAFRDKFAALQHVRVGFIPTSKTDVHDLGPMDEVFFVVVFFMSYNFFKISLSFSKMQYNFVVN